MSNLRVGLKTPAVPGVTTYVKDQGDTAPDRENERALPPGSATPNSPSAEGGGGGRSLPYPQFNKPDNDIDERPRTLPTPGEEYGHPVKEDYNYVTRRSMTADHIGIDEGVPGGDRVAYQRHWRPGRRQRKTRGIERTKRRLQYRKHRNEAKRRAKIRYRKIRNNPRFKALNKHRRTHPNQHRRRMASAEVVASLFLNRVEVELPSPVLVAALHLEGWRPPEEVFPIRHQRRQLPKDRLESRREYRRNRSRKIREMTKRYHQFCKKNPRCQRKREMQRKYPNRFVRKAPLSRDRKASVLTTPEMYFAFGPELLPGVVRSISPMTSMVTFSIQVKDHDHLKSMLLLPFIHSVVFYSDEDIDAFFELVDVELGDEVFEEFTEADLRACAQVSQVDVESDEFLDACARLVGESDVSAMTPDQLETVNEEIVLRLVEWGDMQRELGLEEDFDEHLYYGDVDVKSAGITFQYDQEPPTKSVDHPDKGVRSLPSGPTTWQFVDVNDEGGDTVDRKDDNASPSTSRVVPNGQYVKAAATMDDLATKTSRDVHSRAQKVAIRLRRADPKRGIWMFEAKGSKGNYQVYVKGTKKGNVQQLDKAQIQVSCSCDFFRFQGPEHWASTNDYLYGKPRGTAEAPDIKDAAGQHWVCKHVLAALNIARKYRFGSEGTWSLDGELLPDLPAASRVAARFLGGLGRVDP